jgi:hypothetical protein
VRYPISVPNVLSGNKVCCCARTTTFHELSQRFGPSEEGQNTVLKMLKTEQGRYTIVVTVKSFLRGYNDSLLIVFRARN